MASALMWFCLGSSSSPLGKVSITYSLLPTNRVLLCLPLLGPACLQLPPSVQDSEEIAMVVGVGEDSSSTISWMQAWGKSELMRKESALVPLEGDSFRASWPFPSPLPLLPGIQHPVRPCTEVVVLQAAHPLWVGAKEVCKKGRLIPLALHFHFAPSYKLGT